MKSILMLLIVLSCLGCGGKVMFAKSGATTADFESDKFGCEMTARSYAASFSGSTMTPASLGGAMGSGIGAGITEALSFNSAMTRCMEARGWTKQ